MDADAERWPAADDWFIRLPAPERAALHDQGGVRRYRPASTLFHEGDASDWVLLLTEGRVKVVSTTATGRDVVLAVCMPGELVGERSAIDGRPR